MAQVNIQTSQNVQIQYNTAGIGDRIAAFLLDVLIVFSFFFGLMFLMALVEFDYSTSIGLIMYLPVFFYHLICEIFLDGQSLGKKQLKIKVVKLDGSQPSVGAYILRWLLRPIDITLYGSVAILCIVVGGKGQRLGDIVAGTTVVKLKPVEKVSLSPVQSDYQPRFPSVIDLDEKSIQLVKESLKVYRETANEKPVLAITGQIQNMLNISTDLPPVQFLNTVIKDHEHLTSSM